MNPLQIVILTIAIALAGCGKAPELEPPVKQIWSFDKGPGDHFRIVVTWCPEGHKCVEPTTTTTVPSETKCGSCNLFYDLPDTRDNTFFNDGRCRLDQQHLEKLQAVYEAAENYLDTYDVIMKCINDRNCNEKPLIHDDSRNLDKLRKAVKDAK